jgi:hypothetical protein
MAIGIMGVGYASTLSSRQVGGRSSSCSGRIRHGGTEGYESTGDEEAIRSPGSDSVPLIDDADGPSPSGLVTAAQLSSPAVFAGSRQILPSLFICSIPFNPHFPAIFSALLFHDRHSLFLFTPIILRQCSSFSPFCQRSRAALPPPLLIALPQ